jgi:hypothetical protein
MNSRRIHVRVLPFWLLFHPDEEVVTRSPDANPMPLLLVATSFDFS